MLEAINFLPRLKAFIVLFVLLAINVKESLAKQNLRVFYDKLNWTNVYTVKAGDQLVVPYAIDDIFYIDLMYQTDQKNQKSICNMNQRSVKIEHSMTLEAAIKQSRESFFAEVYLHKDTAFVTTKKGKLVVLLLGKNSQNQIVIRKQVSIAFSSQADAQQQHKLIYSKQFELLLFVFNEAVLSLPIIQNIDDLKSSHLSQMQNFRPKKYFHQALCNEGYLYIANGPEGIDIYEILSASKLQFIQTILIYNEDSPIDQNSDQNDNLLNESIEEDSDSDDDDDDDIKDEQNADKQSQKQKKQIKRKPATIMDLNIVKYYNSTFRNQESIEGEQKAATTNLQSKEKELSGQQVEQNDSPNDLLMYTLDYEGGLKTIFFPRSNPQVHQTPRVFIQSKSNIQFSQLGHKTVIILSENDARYILTEYKLNIEEYSYDINMKQFQDEKIEQILMTEKFAILTKEKSKPSIFWHSILKEFSQSEKFLGLPLISNSPVIPRMMIGDTADLPQVDTYLEYVSENANREEPADIVIENPDETDKYFYDQEMEQEEAELNQDEQQNNQGISGIEQNRAEDIQMDPHALNQQDFKKGDYFKPQKRNFQFLFAYSHYSDNKVFIAPFQLEPPFMLCNTSYGGNIQSFGKQYQYTSIAKAKKCSLMNFEKKQFNEPDSLEGSYCQLSHTFSVFIQQSIKKEEELEIGIITIILLLIFVFFLAYRYKKEKLQKFNQIKKDLKQPGLSTSTGRRKRFIKYESVEGDDII